MTSGPGAAEESVLQQAASSFRRAAVNLFAGGLVLVLLDLAQVAAREPAALWSPHRYAAVLLPGALFLAALACVPMVLLGRRPAGARPWTTVRLRHAVPVCAAALGVCTVAAWGAVGRTLQLPLDSSLVIGTGTAAFSLCIATLIGKWRPPTALLAGALLWGVYIAAEPFHRTVSQHAILPVLVLWLLAASVKWPHPKIVATAAVLLSVFGLYGYGDDMGAVSRLVRRSVIASPSAQTIRTLVDFDSDGYSAILGGGDCDDFDAAVSPRELEVVGNGVDDNCLGGDLAEYEPIGTGTRGQNEPVQPLPDIIILSLDAVRADFLDPELMPNVSGLAEAGLHAPVAYTSAPHTGVAVVGLMTSTLGIDSRRSGRFFGYEPQIGLVLRDAGYRSVAVHCLNDLITDMVQGFDFVDNQLGPRCRQFRGTTAKAMADIAIHYLTQRPEEKPLLLWAHFTDPHLPYYGGYPTELRRVDAAVGRVLSHAKPNTIVVIVSDHGESFGAHGYLGHIWRLDEEMLRVLLIVSGPQVPNKRIPWATTLLDVAPTLAELLGLATPVGWQGSSLLRDPGPRPVVFESNYHGLVDLRGVRIGEHKLTHDRRNNVFELYNVVTDPDDREDLVESDPARFKAMRQELGRLFDELYNDKRIVRKLLLLDSRPNVMPKHIGPLR